MLAWFNAFRKRLFGGSTTRKSDAARNIRREREIFRRWSRRSVEDRFTL